MDSMRTLNTSLPRSPRKKRSKHPPVQTIQAFKTAALEVANLYRAAASDQQLSRQAGYQDALDDLLTFLDRENIGLDDGEGWRVRQWATERLDGNPTGVTSYDSDDEPNEPEPRAKHSTPAAQQVPEEEANVRSTPSLPTARAESVSSGTISTSHQFSVSVPTSDEFTFRTNVPFPLDVEMQGSEAPQKSQTSSASRPQPRSTPQASSVKLEVVPRGSTSNHKAGHSARQNSKSNGSNRATSSAAGSKRRITIADLFDLGDLDEFKDVHGGGGKRTRFG